MMVLVVAWIVCLVGWVWVYLLENQYQAQARVYVDTQSLLRQELTSYPVLGMVTRVETDAMRHHARRMSIGFALALAALLGAYLAQLVYYLFVSQAS
jgi:hypothetical protein